MYSPWITVSSVAGIWTSEPLRPQSCSLTCTQKCTHTCKESCLGLSWFPRGTKASEFFFLKTHTYTQKSQWVLYLDTTRVWLDFPGLPVVSSSHGLACRPSNHPEAISLSCHLTLVNIWYPRTRSHSHTCFLYCTTGTELWAVVPPASAWVFLSLTWVFPLAATQAHRPSGLWSSPAPDTQTSLAPGAGITGPYNPRCHSSSWLSPCDTHACRHMK